MWGFLQSHKSQTVPTSGPEAVVNPDSNDILGDIPEAKKSPEPEDILADVRPLPVVQLNDTLHDIVKKYVPTLYISRALC